MHRRDLLLGSAGALAFVALSRAEAQPATSSASAQLKALFDQFMAEDLDHSPETVTSLGLDKGARAAQKFKLDDGSLAATADAKRRNAEQLRKLMAIDRGALSGQDVVDYDSVLYVTDIQDQANRAFNYGGGGSGAPYVVSQLTGAYQSVPDFLDSQHTVETKADVDAYLSRLEGFAVAVDQDSEQVRHDIGLGVFPPDFILDKTLIQLKALRDATPDKSNLVQSLVRRAKDKHIPGDYADVAARIYTGKVQPALDRQIAMMSDLRGHAVHDAGIARLPQGEAYYRLSLQNWTTTDGDPADIHKTGLELVADYSAQIDAILKSRGMSQGTVGERLRALYDDPQYRYPNTDEGKVKLIADLNVKVSEVQAKLPQWFKTLPKAKLDIRRVPKATEAGAPGGYYQNGSLDGSRPGAYYINLRDTAETPSWVLPTLTFHEGIPGHHLQLSLAQEATLPTIRKIQFFSGYGEGWALYAENLAVEMGMYADDPLGHVGQLHDAMFRAVRLVVDTGLHSQGWSREKAIRYAVDALGDQDATLTTEVERYCVWPGQACSYMLGKLEWLRLRQKAKDAMGDRFDIHTFHDAGLLSGAMPLAVLDRRIETYIQQG
ncbi:DUF885 family protein [Caulobacter sp. S45]|uniref:DUF885 domain-containing protein n=1 Tax=Caulobacter sp. S45 TaxID=1641861 RepID=UPI00157584A5|nr:DUF885 family protein [Caulobacter sp. S45]